MSTNKIFASTQFGEVINKDLGKLEKSNLEEFTSDSLVKLCFLVHYLGSSWSNI